MARSLLTLVQACCSELGLTPQPTTVFGNNDPNIAQLLGLAQREGRTFVKRANNKGGWTALRTEYTFNLVPSQAITAGTNIGTTCTITTALAHNLMPGQQVQVNRCTPAAYNGIVTITSVTTFTFSYVALTTPPGPITTIGTYTFLYPAPPDYQYLQPQTVWDANFRWQMLGPLSPQEWGVLQYGISPVGPRIRYQIRGGLIFVQPPPGSTQTDLVGFNYVSSAWCASAGGNPQQLWLNDSDTYRLDEDCFILGLQWRWKKKKGFYFADDKDDYDDDAATILGRDGGGGRALPLDAVATDVSLLSDANVPDTGFGAT